MTVINERTAKDGTRYYQPENSNLKFSSRELAERHVRVAADNMAQFRATVAAATPEERAAKMRAYFGIKSEG